MIKGALIFATGAGSGLAVGGLLGLISGFNLARDVQNIAINNATTEPRVTPPDSVFSTSVDGVVG